MFEPPDIDSAIIRLHSYQRTAERQVLFQIVQIPEMIKRYVLAGAVRVASLFAVPSANSVYE